MTHPDIEVVTASRTPGVLAATNGKAEINVVSLA
jgi:hypothetical protein